MTNDTVRTTVEVDRDVWRQFKSDAVLADDDVSSHLEAVLRDYYDL